uniref:Uncharacterized protein n=1 Tax=uncultured organism TaxID=155900 RepID=A0A0G2YJL6_9ZZZZ|nr:hypothetical protein [uncultured organism]
MLSFPRRSVGCRYNAGEGGRDENVPCAGARVRPRLTMRR